MYPLAIVLEVANKAIIMLELTLAKRFFLEIWNYFMSDTFEPNLSADGRIIDFLDGILLEDRPEERVRQAFLRVLHDEYKYSKNVMRREVVIMAGSNEAIDYLGNPVRADIVVYKNAAAASKNNQGQIIFVVECKRPDVETGYNQLVSYIYNTSAAGGVWTNGSDVQAFRRLSDPENILERALGFPRNGEGWDAVGRRQRAQLERPRDVRRLLQLCHNKLHGIGIDSDDDDLTMDMVRIILAKAQDEVGTGDLPDFYCTPEEYRTAPGRQEVAKRVQSLFRTFANENHGVFGEHEKITVSDHAIAEVVAVLQGYAIMTGLEDADEWDIMGSAYEQYTATHLKRQRGQFFTNRLVVDFMVKALNPGPDAKSLDPAGGSGGFLTSVLRHVRHRVLESAKNPTAREHQLANMRQRLFMVEVSPRLVKIAKTAMLLNGDGHSGMTKGNSLGPYEKMDDWIKARCGRHQPNLILTNPPFAGTAEGQVTDVEILAQYEVARRWFVGDSGFETLAGDIVEGCPPEMLFFERCLDWLAPGGQLGIVMPKSFLDTATYRPARELLFRNAVLLGVINCHKNTFQPDTGVRTCVVLVRKLRGDETPPQDYKIFFAISRKIGRDSEGRPIFKIDANGDTTSDIDHDMDEILSAFAALQNGNLNPSGYRFAINRQELDDGLNINPQRYLPHLNESLRQIQEMDGRGGWTVTSLAHIEQNIKIYKGPRLKTENLLVEHSTDGTKVEPYYTPSAVLQDKRDSIKWLDLAKASPKQLKDYDAVRVMEGDLLITRSGTIGRVAYITTRLHKTIVSDDAIRVRIESDTLRAYVYAYLQSTHAQNQLSMNEYGAVQQHLEPSHVADLLIPIPDDWTKVESAVRAAENFFQSKERAESFNEMMLLSISNIIGTASEKIEEDQLAGTSS